MLPSCLLQFFIYFFFIFSAATLPTTIRCVELNNNINPVISRFMLPLGATINMDGLAIDNVVITIFIAQLNNIPLSPGRTFVVWYVNSLFPKLVSPKIKASVYKCST